ncbi:glutathione S-transferase N-terminal domain-containing protein [Acidithiobacillus caldus]|jgi:RNA polymerase-associated protein|uniref:Stringent starvation protein A n=3 Tax=Acidithiobacillus caldus TaxID=33059 RepID=F9ZQV5_ACICS|nr:glutathione S-transferase N-terminal domain-containing protein [Acidithiobacillus caldus]AEK59294.1 Stringent starvation protein A [Acidithiobacillus caldus SM-1]AIA56338.1 Stringent starvation protein A [Acidithiobacillus caldus ATCC 51756]AUW33675.1 stringent starvation protein A [Acidithiobacillus caldus]MBU2730968.1 stringent starvation protein A [Acidithiobacillus caldus]MBU2735370.1 stringent starvation protein A [Acidithiobacillus caldus ATCC 51756]
MATPSNKKTLMTLYSAPDCVFAHRVRFVLEEKAMEYQTIDVDLTQKPEDLTELNPYGEVPTLVDRELAIYDSMLIMEYLDERFPHPPLIPVDPISRAKVRVGMLRFERDWFEVLYRPGHSSKEIQQTKENLRTGLATLSSLFSQQRFLFGDELSIADAALAPLLWRLPALGVELPKGARATQDYMERIFNMESFKRSLTATEKALR